MIALRGHTYAFVFRYKRLKFFFFVKILHMVAVVLDGVAAVESILHRMVESLS